ncbi:hypothetical protein HJG60_011604 [Phyllostomus discolor]|uniref:Uncharacterized protein n=1 Tax=Phyllostomus discolor TaxID=89673 RepID=A0A833ZU34_9CHIR|nr:hypothetical protein HJG60_011604 [Phyllostomus discolor]
MSSCREGWEQRASASCVCDPRRAKDLNLMQVVTIRYPMKCNFFFLGVRASRIGKRREDIGTGKQEKRKLTFKAYHVPPFGPQGCSVRPWLLWASEVLNGFSNLPPIPRPAQGLWPWLQPGAPRFHKGLPPRVGMLLMPRLGTHCSLHRKQGGTWL